MAMNGAAEATLMAMYTLYSHCLESISGMLILLAVKYVAYS